MKKFLLLPLLGLFFYLPAQIVYIPDLNFKYALVNTNCFDSDADGYVDSDVDTNDDSEIQVSEALAVTLLDVSDRSIESLIGIESFSNLVNLYCDDNQLTSISIEGLISLQVVLCGFNPLTSLNFGGLSNLNTISCAYSELSSIDLQGLPNLQTLHFAHSKFTTFDAQGLINLEVLDCSYNLLTSLNLQGLNNLVDLDCSNNSLTSINIQGLNNLKEFTCAFNQITSIDFSGMSSIEYMSIAYNDLTTVDVHDLINLKTLNCPGNQLFTLNIQDLHNLDWLNCVENQLISLFIKNGSQELDYLDFDDNPNLVYICCDESQLIAVQAHATSYGLNNCSINSYCSFSPGEAYNSIQGENKLDVNNDGCDPDDVIFPYLKFNISNGSSSGTIISNNSGNYFIPVEAGEYSFIPVLDNPGYFAISPEMIFINFPDAGDTLIQNFCLMPNGIRHDLEISIIPILPARPGFEATYDVIYKNNGNQIENGGITVNFDDALMDFIEASTIPDNQVTNVLQWNFNDLLPFETRVINLTFDCNSPSEIPPLNVDDILSFGAIIQGAKVDETPDDNDFSLLQTVVGSFDPNDKTCLEGAIISEEMVGDFVHYLIRFENTGTYPAENIVVKDIINTNTFDITSLQIVSTSHEVWTRIVNGNQVEFIFEDIQLPFEDATNDGYIAFKIKTKPDLVIGDTLNNVAAIYFDYNLPIITNEAQSIVQHVPVSIENVGLGNKELEVFPNPTKDILYFKTTHAISKVEIFDIHCRILQSIGINENQVNLKGLPSGTYLLKVYVLDEFYFSRVIKM